MRAGSAGVAVLMLAAGTLFAYEWPLASPEVSRTFGTCVDRSFSTSVVIASPEETVRSVEAGEVVFYAEGGEGPLGGLGAWVAVRHQENLVSVYAGLKPGSVPSYLKELRSGAVLGLAGEGRAQDYETRFMLYDREKSRWVNPLLFLAPVQDRKTPVIRSVSLKRDALPVDLSVVRAVRQGRSDLIAAFSDPGPAAQAGSSPDVSPGNAPFQVQVLLNGMEVLNLLWDVAREKDGRIVLFADEGLSSGDFLLDDGSYRVGTLPIVRGKSALDLIVTDFARNSRTASFAFQAE